MNCPVCKSPNHRSFGTVKQFNPNLHFEQCLDCKSLWQDNPIADPDEYYKEDYYSGNASFSYYDGRKSYRADSIVHKARLETIKTVFNSYNNKNEIRLLDVGCAFGSFVRTACETGPAAGLDVSRYSISAGNDWIGREEVFNFRGLYRGNLRMLPDIELFQTDFFNVITMIEVAEHLHNPIDNFKSAFNLLPKNGILVVQTANFDGRQAEKKGLKYHYLLPGHLTCYTATGMKRMLQEIGFREFIEFIPVDFTLLTKLKKAGYGFKWINVFRMFRISYYHLISKIKWKGQPLTSSWVLYAIK